MPCGRGGRGAGRGRGRGRSIGRLFSSSDDDGSLIEEWAGRRAEESSTDEDHAVYARVETIVSSSEFVLDFPEFDEYLSVPYSTNEWYGEYDHPYYEPIRGVFVSDFNADGIIGKMHLKEDGSTCHVNFEARLANHEISTYTCRFSAKAFVVKDQRQILVASGDDAKRQNYSLVVMGKPLLIPCADIVEKAKLLGNGTTLRVVLNIEIKSFKQRSKTYPIVGICGVNKQSDPPFLKPLQGRQDSDVQLICEDETFPVHGFILKNVSHVFRRMLEVPMQEAATREIVIEDLSADTVKKMVDYIYHGRINVGSDAQVVDLLYAAEKYEFDLLKTACLEGMVTSMSNENVTTFLEISVRVNAGNEVIKQMVAYCMNRIVELRKREDFRAFAQANSELFL